MKKIFIAFIVLLSVYSAQAQTATPQQVDIAKVLKFTNDNFDMGKITTGKPTEFNVDIQNVVQIT